MYKSKVKHQCDIHHGQDDSDKDYFGELPAGMFHLSVIFTECFTPPGCVAEFAEQVGKKAEHHHYGKSNNPTEIAKHQRCSKRYEYGKEPTKEQQHTPVKVGMLPFVPYLGYIPHIVDEAEPVFAIVLIHIVTIQGSLELSYYGGHCGRRSFLPSYGYFHGGRECTRNQAAAGLPFVWANVEVVMRIDVQIKKNINPLQSDDVRLNFVYISRHPTREFPLAG